LYCRAGNQRLSEFGNDAVRKSKAIKTITLSHLEADLRNTLKDCADSGAAVVVQLPDQRLVAIQPLDPTDEQDDLVSELLESNAAFRSLVARSAASPRKPFPLPPSPTNE
jgi:hypothetical protein